MHHLVLWEILFSSIGQKIGFTQCLCIKHLFKYYSITILRVRDSKQHFLTETHV